MSAGGPAISSSGCTTTGIVTAVRDGRVDVEFAAPPRCNGCDGACLWYRVTDSQHATFATELELVVGSAVTVTLPDRYLLRGALLVYGVPLAALLAGALLGWALFGSDLAAAAGGMLGLVAALAAAPALRQNIERVTVRDLRLRPVGS